MTEKNINAILLEGVTKTFQKKQVLRNIGFSVQRGDLFGFLGPNGAGKTTTMRIILGLLDPDGGTVLVDGRPFKNEPAVRRRTGVILEGHGLYEDMSLFDNIYYYASLFGMDEGKSKTEEMIHKVGLTPKSGAKVGTFSSGMKKKAALARSLVHEPEYLFLDEPTTGLDPEAQVEFRELIRHLSEEKGITLFFNSHNLDEVQKICNKVAIIGKGSVLVSDSVRALQKRYSEPTVGITLYSEGDARKLCALLEDHEKITDIKNDNNTVEAVLREDSFTLRELLSYGVEIKEFTTKVKTLEDVYMEIVGEKDRSVW